MHLVIVIPAYNEDRVISDVIEAIPKAIKKITKITPLVIDDNSKDATAKQAKKSGAVCIRHEMNLGTGGAILTGIEAAKHMKADIVVTMDGDGQHDPHDIRALIQPIIQDNADVVLGSRLMSKQNKNMPTHRTVGNKLLNLATFLLCGLWVSDSQSGYKALSRKSLDIMQLSSSGYEFHSEIIGEIKRNHLRYKEVPISTIYTTYSKSKAQPALNAINIVLGLLSRGMR
jgi:UDP-N-acetylglucosamine---dolichyl-phosphate N-acetylglucosaminyltransferase